MYHNITLRGPGGGGGGGLHQNSLEINFIVVADGGGNMYQMLLVPWKKIVPSRNYCRSKVSAYE